MKRKRQTEAGRKNRRRNAGMAAFLAIAFFSLLPLQASAEPQAGGIQTGELQAGGPDGSNMRYSGTVQSRIERDRYGNELAVYEDSSLGLGGASIAMLRGRETEQQLSLVIRGSDGQLIVVDGGSRGNAAHLAEYLWRNGGRVSAWLLTHPHADHVGALAELLKKKGGPAYANLELGNIYYSFAPLSFYQANEAAYRLPMIEEIYAALGSYDQTKAFSGLPAGTSFDIGNINVRILNRPYEFSEDPGNNTSVAYMLTINGKRLLITGDLPYEASEQLLKEQGAEALRADIVQMAHHGQHGGSPAFYRAVHPTHALWPSPQSVWERTGEAFTEDQSSYTPALTKHWMDQLSVKNYVMADGDWILK